MPIHRERKVRTVLASFVGATVAYTPPVLGGLYTVLGPGFVNPGGSPDNAPARGAGLFIPGEPFSISGCLGVLCAQHPAPPSVESAFLLFAVFGQYGDRRRIMGSSHGRTGARTVNVLATAAMSGLLGALLLAGSMASWLVLRRGPTKR